MIRILPLLALTVAACTAEPSVSLETRSELARSTRGVVLHDDGRADAAMAGMICVVDTYSGRVVGDRDLTDGTELVFDAADGRTLGSVDGRLHALDESDLTVDFDLGLRAVDARFTDDGSVIALAPVDPCTVQFSGTYGTVAWELDGTECSQDVGFTVDRATGTAWVADGSSLVQIDVDGSTLEIPDADVDLVDWNGLDGLAIVADAGHTLVRGVDVTGMVQWGTNVSGGVVDLATASDAGLVIVSTSDADGGEILVLDGGTGEQLVSFLVPEAAEVVISPDGATVGLITPESVRFYDMDAYGSAMDAPTADMVEDLHGVAAGTAVLWGAAVAVAIVD